MLVSVLIWNTCYLCRRDASAIARATGCKSSYSLMKLPHHNPLMQVMPDAMHTVKDVVENLFGLIVGKRDSEKVREAERKLGRLPLSSGTLPYRLTKKQLELTDTRIRCLRVPIHIDFWPKPMFVKLIGTHEVSRLETGM